MSLPSRILKRVQGHGRGWVFVPRDFADLGARDAVDQTLGRLTKRGKIRRLGQGIYDYPQRHPLLGALSPSPGDIARAAARSTRSIVEVSGAQAANALGLSTQVPARPVYLTDGNSRTVVGGPYRVILRRAAPRNLVGAGTAAGGVFQALRYLGRDGVTDGDVASLGARLDPDTKSQLRSMRQDFPGWMRPIIARVTDSTPMVA